MSDRKKLIVLGARTFAQDVADVVSECDEFELVGFAENMDRQQCKSTLEGLPVYWVDDLARLADDHWAVCALFTTRRSLFTGQVDAIGMRFATVVHPTARVSTKAALGDGCVVNVGAMIATHTVIGRHVIVNRGVMIGHHASIGDHVSIGPGANIAGKVAIGPSTYVGMGAIVLDGVSVGANCLIGAGSVVTKDLPDNVQAMGVPAKIIKTAFDGK
jgi:sugar O-acyltransferase (sialic acid O-acetyltransferase NeuD family)